MVLVAIHPWFDPGNRPAISFLSSGESSCADRRFRVRAGMKSKILFTSPDQRPRMTDRAHARKGRSRAPCRSKSKKTFCFFFRSSSPPVLPYPAMSFGYRLILIWRNSSRVNRMKDADPLRSTRFRNSGPEAPLPPRTSSAFFFPSSSSVIV